MAATALFMLVWGLQLVRTTWHQVISEFPLLSVGLTYLPAAPGGPPDPALHHRAGVGRRASAHLGDVPRPGRGAGVGHAGRARPPRRLRRAVRDRHARRLRARAGRADRGVWVDIPLEAVMLKMSDGTDDFSLLAIPFFVLAGAIMAEGGMAVRLIDLAKVFVGFIRGGLALVNVLAMTLLGCISGSSVADTSAIGSVMIPADGPAGLPARLLDQRHHLRVDPDAAHSALAQHGDLLDRGRRHGLGGRTCSSPACSPGCCSACASSVWCCGRRTSGASPGSAPVPLRQVPQDRARRRLGADHHRHHHGRHPVAASSRPPNRPRSPASTRSSCTVFVYRDYKLRDLPHLLHRVVKTVAMVMMLIGFSVAFGYMMAHHADPAPR